MGEKLVSAWQQPENRWAELPNSIHNDAVATRIGMRGGTIPGTVHLNHFVPLIQSTFGSRWYQRGTISMFYTFATTHREKVRAVMDPPSGAENERLDALVETPEGKIVAKGSISVGSPAGADYVASLPLEDAPRDELRILQDLLVGEEAPPKDNVVITEGGGTGDEAGVLIYPAAMYGALNVGFPPGKIRQPSVGFFGATEIRLLDGPVRLNTGYRRTGKVVCVGASPKTEFAWVDSALLDERGKTIAEMRHLTRWMKSSSDLWS